MLIFNKYISNVFVSISVKDKEWAKNDVFLWEAAGTHTEILHWPLFGHYGTAIPFERRNLQLASWNCTNPFESYTVELKKKMQYAQHVSWNYLTVGYRNKGRLFNKASDNRRVPGSTRTYDEKKTRTHTGKYRLLNIMKESLMAHMHLQLERQKWRHFCHSSHPASLLCHHWRRSCWLILTNFCRSDRNNKNQHHFCCCGHKCERAFIQAVQPIYHAHVCEEKWFPEHFFFTLPFKIHKAS